jgi:hypothetical protein
MALRKVERTHASPADRIVRNIKLVTESHRLWTIHDLLQAGIVNVPQAGMKETGPDVALCTDHSRNPWCIAARSDGLCLPEIDTELLDDAP